jgi:hypothetical protein
MMFFTISPPSCLLDAIFPNRFKPLGTQQKLKQAR